MAGVIEQVLGGGRQVLAEGIYLEQAAVVVIGDEINRATGTGTDGGHPRGLCLLNGLAESLEFTGVDEEVQGGISLSETLTVEGSRENRIRHQFFEDHTLRAIADDDQLDILAPGKRCQAVDTLLSGQTPDETDDLLAAVRVPATTETGVT